MSIGQDWWRWDPNEVAWRSIIGGQFVTPTDPFEPDPDDPAPDPTGRQVLLVTSTGGLSVGNQALHDILVADGWTVTVRPFDAEEDYVGMSVVVLSVGNPSGGSDKYLFPPVGVVAVDSWRQVGMGDDLGFAKTPPDVTVVDTSSPLAAGISGTFQAYATEEYVTWKPETDAALTTVVTRAGQPTDRVVFAYEAGSVMPGRFATTRHVGLGYHQDGFASGLSPEAKAQFLAAVRWARDTAQVPLAAPAAPTGLSAIPGDSRVALSWSGLSDAEGYRVHRGTATGGPYTVLASVSTTSYVDTTAVNDTTYFYVVSAFNASGEGPVSAEVSATPTVSASENLAMLATSVEVEMWRDRAANGPFKTKGDFSPNSPGHWDAMVTAAGRAPFDSARWDGPTVFDSDGSVTRTSANVPRSATDNMAHDMYSAAIVAVTNNNTTLAQQIVAEIRWQATRPNLDYGNRSLWPFDKYDDVGPLFKNAMWVRNYVLAYDLCKSLGQTSSTVEQWFLDMAELCEQIVHANMSRVFPNRTSDSYGSRSSFVNSDVAQGSHRLADGTIIYFPRILRFYNNRRNNLAGLVGLVGALLDNQFYKDRFKIYMREWVMFGNRLGDYGGYGDHNRGTDSFPQLGWSYSVHGVEALMPAMEGLARQGDTDLYEFSSSDGCTHPTWGTAHLKSMEDCIDQHLKWVAQTWPAQYTDGGASTPSGIAGDPYYRVQSRRTSNNREIVNDSHFLYAANYYNRADWYDIVNRVGTPTGFTSTVQAVGHQGGSRPGWRLRFTRSLSARPDYS